MSSDKPKCRYCGEPLVYPDEIEYGVCMSCAKQMSDDLLDSLHYTMLAKQRAEEENRFVFR